ncbi:MAG: phage holin family protein [Gallionella sp.]
MAGQGAGLLDSVKRLASTLIEIGSTRLELLANELQEERLHLTQMFFLSLLALFSFGMALLLLTIFITVLFWDDHRIAVLGGLCILFFVSGILIAFRLRSKAQSRPKLFSASLAELARDREHLGPGE